MYVVYREPATFLCVRNHGICRLPGWMPYAQSATGASVNFIDRECDRPASTLNCMGKYGPIRPNQSTIVDHPESDARFT